MYFLWERFSFIVISFVILGNYRNLKKMNIDRGFLVLYIVVGVIFSIQYFWTFGWLAFCLVGLIVYMLLSNKFHLEQHPKPNPVTIVVVLIVVFCLYWLYKMVFIGTPMMGKYIAFFLMGLPFWVVEEIIFRGLIWMNLEELGWRSFSIILVQSLIFWVFHIKYMVSDPFLFWLQIPFFSIFLGVLVWRYKSINPSSVAHIFFNLR
jgi:membrane protease YdiL (CAAX protease family)